MEEVKDELYYADLIYKVKSLAGIITKKDDEVEGRILEREELKAVLSEGSITYIPSMFHLDLFSIIREISKRIGVPINSLYEISNYKEEVQSVLEKLEVSKQAYTRVKRR